MTLDLPLSVKRLILAGGFALLAAGFLAGLMTGKFLYS